EQSRRPARAVGRHGLGGDRASRGAGRGSFCAPDLEEPGRHPLSQRSLRACRQARPRPGRRSVLQAGEHRIQAARQVGRARELEPGHHAQSGPRAGPREPRDVGDGPVTADEAAFAALSRQIARTSGFTLEAYKDKCIRRRIAVRMRACGVHTYDDYRALLSRSPAEYERLRDALTINVTRFYRNAETWNLLRRTVLPELFDRPRIEVRVWSAGCASGEEPYTL